MNVCLFEDQGYEALYPLTYLRPTFELRCGLTTLEDKFLSELGMEDIYYAVRDSLVPIMTEKKGKDRINNWEELRGKEILLLNGGWLIQQGDLPSIEGANEAGCKGDRVLWVRLSADKTADLNPQRVQELIPACLKRCETQKDFPKADLILEPWDLITNNPKAIEADFRLIKATQGESGALSEGVAVLGDPSQVWVAASAELQPFTLLDTRGGPVIIDEKSVVTSFTRIEGPSCLGRGSQTLGAKVREGTSIGPFCRIGGEVEESIFHAYSNKYHDGFIGHSYVCEWVNLGALCTNSDLKNDYTSVSVYTPDGPKDTGSAKIGSFIGDHTKTSIGTLLNTGSWVGIMCNLVATGGVLPKFIPSFAWYIGGKITKGFGFEAMLDTCRTSMSRRGVDMTDSMVALLQQVKEDTKQLRQEIAKKDRKKK